MEKPNSCPLPRPMSARPRRARTAPPSRTPSHRVRLLVAPPPHCSSSPNCSSAPTGTQVVSPKSSSTAAGGAAPASPSRTTGFAPADVGPQLWHPRHGRLAVPMWPAPGTGNQRLGLDARAPARSVPSRHSAHAAPPAYDVCLAAMPLAHAHALGRSPNTLCIVSAHNPTRCDSSSLAFVVCRVAYAKPRAQQPQTVSPQHALAFACTQHIVGISTTYV